MVWTNAGMAAADIYRINEAERMYKRAVKVAHLPSVKANVHTNWAALLIDHGRFAEAEGHCPLDHWISIIHGFKSIVVCL